MSTIIHELMREAALGDRTNLITVKPSLKHFLSFEDVVNVLWSCNVTDGYEDAVKIAEIVTGAMGFEITSLRGKFFKRSKEVIKKAIIDCAHTFDATHWTDEDWGNVFDRLRTAFGGAAGVSDDNPTHRNYWICPSHTAMILGPTFSLHSGSCYWTSYKRSIKVIHGCEGYMLRGVYGNQKISTNLDVYRQRIGSVIVEVPIIDDYCDTDNPMGMAVRTWIVPLKDDAIAVFNGYKANVAAHVSDSNAISAFNIFDFSPRTRHHFRAVYGTPLRTVCNDLANHFSANGKKDVVVREVLKRYESNDANDPGGFINNDAFFIVGAPDGEFMKHGWSNGLAIADEAKMIPRWWQCKDSGEYQDDILDYKENGVAEDDDNDDDDTVEIRDRTYVWLRNNEHITDREWEAMPEDYYERTECRDWLLDYRESNPDYESLRVEAINDMMTREAGDCYYISQREVVQFWEMLRARVDSIHWDYGDEEYSDTYSIMEWIEWLRADNISQASSDTSVETGDSHE